MATAKSKKFAGLGVSSNQLPSTMGNPEPIITTSHAEKSTMVKIPPNSSSSPSTLDTTSSAVDSIPNTTDHVFLNLSVTKRNFAEVTRGLLKRVVSTSSTSSSQSSEVSDTRRKRLKVSSAVPDPLEPRKYNPVTKAKENKVPGPHILNERTSLSKPVSINPESLKGDRKKDETMLEEPKSGTESPTGSIEYRELYGAIANMNPFGTYSLGLDNSPEDSELRGTIFPSPRHSTPIASTTEQQGERVNVPSPNPWTSHYTGIIRPQRLNADNSRTIQYRQGQAQGPTGNVQSFELKPAPKGRPFSQQYRSTQVSSPPRTSDTQASSHRSHSKNVSFALTQEEQNDFQLRNYMRTDRSGLGPNTIGSASQGFYTHKTTDQPPASGSSRGRHASSHEVSLGSPVSRRSCRTHNSGSENESTRYPIYVDHNTTSPTRSKMTVNNAPTRPFEKNQLRHTGVQSSVMGSHDLSHRHSSFSYHSNDNAVRPKMPYSQQHYALAETEKYPEDCKPTPIHEHFPRGTSQLTRSKSTPKSVQPGSHFRSMSTAKKDLSEPTNRYFVDSVGDASLTRRDTSPVKRSRSPTKQMFGEHGWLHRGNSMNQMAGQKPKMLSFKNFAIKVKQKTDDTKSGFSWNLGGKRDEPDKTGPKKEATSASTISTFPVSIEYSDQMRLWGELELMLKTVVNDFLIRQMEAGRMSVSSIQKVTKDWANRGRPQILEFHFDLETQLELIKLNSGTFRFHGEDGPNGMKQAVMFNCFRGVVRELSIRSYCAPDSVVKKILVDSYRIIEMMGASYEIFMLLQHIQAKILGKIEAARLRRAKDQSVVYGVPRPFVIPVTDEDKDELDDGIYRG